MNIKDLLAFAKDKGASDLHVVSNHAPSIRIHGSINTVKTETLAPETVLNMLHSIMTERQRQLYEQELEIDFAVNFGGGGRFRVNAFSTINGPAASFRDIPDTTPDLNDLGMPEVVKTIPSLTKGLVLVTGPTGHGKSTTLAAIIDKINSNYKKHIITIEDPIEYVHQSKKSLVNQREVGTHTKSFDIALRSALREDPDVILIGEMRDLETMRLALTAAETGHLVLGTLHTNSAPQSVDRIVDTFPSGDKSMARSILASALEVVITQFLVKTADGNGRAPIVEVLLANSAVRNLIRDDKIQQIPSIMQINSKKGMKTMEDSVIELIANGTITEKDAKSALNYRGASEEDEADKNKENF